MHNLFGEVDCRVDGLAHLQKHGEYGGPDS